MLELLLNSWSTAPGKILFLGAHSDDIEIGCGAVILQLAQNFPETEMHWVVFSSDETRTEETQTAARLFAGEQISVSCKHFRNSFFPAEFARIKEFFEKIKQDIDPDVIFTHYGDDLHQDHRIISELTWNTFRSHLIFEYEIPKYDSDLGNPSVFLPVTKSVAEQKAKIIMDAFISQHHRQWFSSDTFLSLLRLRGIQCNAPDGYAEAYYSRKLTLRI